MKTLEKFLTRDFPLITAEYWWHHGFNSYFRVFFEFEFPKVIFASESNAFVAYRDEQTITDSILNQLVKWFERNEGATEAMHKILRDGLKFFDEIKIEDSTSLQRVMEYLQSTVNLLPAGCISVFTVAWLPIFQERFARQGKTLFNDDFIGRLSLMREKEGNYFSNEAGNVVYSLLSEIAKRRDWNMELLKYITYNELLSTMNQDISLPLDILSARRSKRFAYVDGDIIFEPNIMKSLSDKGYRIKSESAIVGDPCKGAIAYKGTVEGIARVVFTRSELLKVKSGDILIAPMTSPWHLPAMKKAAGFVTDEGGITCHAAVVAREMRKPCIIGTKHATEIFKDGDFVEVDATSGVVRKL